MKAIINGKIITKNDILENKIIIFDDNIIGFYDNIEQFYIDKNIKKNIKIEILDAKGLYISPGLIDIHIHGSSNHDAMDKSIESIQIIGNSIKKYGVTSFLATTMTMSQEDIYKALDSIKEAMTLRYDGAEILGAHLEGPFISSKYKGAQSDKFIKKPSFEFIKNYLDIIKIISYAPEMDDDFKFTKEIKENTDIVLSVAHSNATYSQTMSAINLGLSNATHLFNAMSPLNHREMGVVGAALSSDIYCELICDNIHLNTNLYQFVLNNKGKNKIILITDCMSAGSMPEGKYSLGGQDVFVKDKAARLENGSLAGSVLNLNDAVNNFRKNTNLSINEAINLASLNPATSINIDDKKGSLDIGKDADIALFDEDMNCYMTISKGNIIYNRL